MTATDMPTFRSILTEQQLADGIATEGLRLARERDAARRALRIERADHAETKTELHRARILTEQQARRIVELELRLDQAQQQAAPTAVGPLPHAGRRL